MHADDLLTGAQEELRMEASASKQAVNQGAAQSSQGPPAPAPTRAAAVQHKQAVALGAAGARADVLITQLYSHMKLPGETA